MAGSNDSVKKTVFVAVTLCVVCSIIVSTAAVALKERQDLNKALDKKKNVLEAAGLKVDDPSEIDKIFSESIEARVVDFEKGAFVEEGSVDLEEFDQRKEAKNPATSLELDQDDDPGGIKLRENRSLVYLVKKDDKLSKIILPVKGMGLWGQMYGLLTLGGADFNTIHALVFYEHIETPGLGGEIENPRWKSLWEGKKVRDEAGVHQIRVIKGAAQPDRPHEIDGLSGATITSRGVTNLIKFWLGDKAFGPFLRKLAAETAAGGGE